MIFVEGAEPCLNRPRRRAVKSSWLFRLVDFAEIGPIFNKIDQRTNRCGQELLPGVVFKRLKVFKRGV